MLKKVLLITAGFSSLTAGFIGIFLPVLPTTPFVLLAGFCFVKSSKNLFIWLINNKIFGKYIRNYLKYKAVTFKSKVFTISLLWGVILTSVIFFVSNLIIDILLIFVAIAVSIHLMLLKVIK